MKILVGAVLSTVALAWSAFASGPERYETPFVKKSYLRDVLAGDFPDRLWSNDVVFPLVIYLHLSGRFTDSHAALFPARDMKSVPRPSAQEMFWTLAWEEGYERPAKFARWKVVSRVHADPRNPDDARTVEHYIHNCQRDAFKTAAETLSDRKSRHGSGSIEFSRWMEAQITVFGQCSGETPFVPPDEPARDWLPLERHDRRYQIAAAYFYDGQYLEAASRFGEIGRTADSPWRDLGRYLVARSLAREATVNENDSVQHLRRAVKAYRELAEDPEYLAAFPSVSGQIRHLRTRIDPAAVRRELEQRIFDDPASISTDDLFDYAYLRRQAVPTDREASTDYEHWLRYVMSRQGTTTEGAVEQWQAEQSLPWLYVALSRASTDIGETTLTELLEAAEVLPEDTPGRFNMLLQRIRILGLLGRVDAGLGLAEETLGKGLDRSQSNRVRLAVADLTLNWPDYLRWASLKPLSLPWKDESVHGLPWNYSRITTDTTLFGQDATELINDYFTSPMIEDVIDTRGLSGYQRGRLAIAGWTKAMLADDLESALKLSAHIRRHVPWLDREMAQFEEGDDRHFEAARIIFDYPAFSPWMEPGAGRISWPDYRQVSDRVTYGPSVGSGWWCAAWREHRTSEGMLRSPRFSRFSESELAAVRQVTEYRETAATTSFGPHVVRYARDQLDDPRVPRTLHRLVFATRYACGTWRAPGKISQAAYALLHEHFADSEWAAKTPYWYGQLD